MNTSTLLRSAGAALLLAPLTSALAQAWQTVDAYQMFPGLSANATDITSDPTGTLLYSVGGVTSDVAGNRTGAIRISGDQGANWTTMDAYFEPGWQTHFRGVGTDSGGTVFAAGQLFQSSPVFTMAWVVRESSDGGLTWGTTDHFEQVPGGRSSCGDIKVSPSGHVFAAGYGGTSNGLSWVVRMRAPGQPSFVTAEAITSSFSGEARMIAFHPTAGVLVAGRVANVWTVRRSIDGVNWVPMDSFKDTGGSSSSAEAITVDGAGTIYVAGRADQSVRAKGRTIYSNNWVVRRSTNGGATWAVVDRFGALGQGSAEGITVGNGGTVFVSGSAPDSWVVRKGSTDATGKMNWTTSEQFQLVPGQSATAWGITTGLGGNIFATGGGNDATGVSHWVTRKLMP
jgi:hypothetical protein